MTTMACYHPLTGYKSQRVNSNGKRNITFQLREGYIDFPIKIPCGRCIGCKLERSRQWAIRCVHEAQMHENNCFITLTYNNKNLPKDNSLNVKHFQDFMKRLRKAFGSGIRFFHCGEYGDENKRPHYHACLFNFDFLDKQHWSTRDGVQLYTSKTLEKLWPFGFCTIGDVTFESAAYVARYVTKKITGQYAFDHYTDYDKETGEIITERRPEYCTMSRRPGIGRPWLDKYQSDVYPSDEVIMNYKSIKPPKYYDRVYEIDNLSDFEKIKIKRTVNAKLFEHENTRDRLDVREFIKLDKFKQLKRSMIDETETDLLSKLIDKPRSIKSDVDILLKVKK